MYLNQKRKAFTLVELLVVMGIIVVLAAVTLPSIRTLLQGQKITQAARMVQAHVEAARARAIASQSYVAVVMERQYNSASDSTSLKNTVTRLATGQVFPPYQGDVVGATGTLTDESGDGFFDRITVLPFNGSLITSDTFGAGDFIQFADRNYTFVINAHSTGTGVIDFINPPRTGTTAKEEPQLPITSASEVTFKIFRKPTKSFVQPSVLPRGTCIDLSVSGMGPNGNEFFSAPPPPPPPVVLTTPGPVMIVFDQRGSVAYWNDGAGFPQFPAGVIHLHCGRTEQIDADAVFNAISTAGQLPRKSDTDPASFNANLNDTENVWISINPYSGAIYSSSVVAGDESNTLANRIRTARSFATNSVTRSAN